MKRTFFLFLACLMGGGAWAQSAEVKKIEVGDFKAFEVGLPANGKILPAAYKTLSESIKVLFFGENLELESRKGQTITFGTNQILASFDADAKKSMKDNGIPMGIVGIDYAIDYNDKGILSFTVATSTMGAYPDGYQTIGCLDLNTGKRITASRIFLSKDAEKKALALLKQKIKARAQEKIKDMKAQGETGEEISQMLSQEPSTDNLSFNINKEGIRYYHEFGFPHAMAFLEPESFYVLTWQEVGELIKRDGVLARILGK